MPNPTQMYPQTPAERERLDNMLQKVEPTPIMPGRPATAQASPEVPAEAPKLTRPILSTTKQPGAASFADVPDTVENFQKPNAASIQNPPTSATVPSLGLLPVEKTTTTVQSTALRPEDKNAISESQKALDIARTENLDAKTSMLKAQADSQYEYANKVKAEADLLKQEQERVSALKEENRQRYLNKVAEYEGIKVENPWANMSTGSKIMAAISIALGGLAGENGRNSALEIINSNIARDIDIQKANIDKKKGELNAIQQYGQELRQMGMDDMAVREAMIGMGKQQLAAQLDALKMRIGEKDPRYPAVAELQQKFAQDALDEKMKIAEFGAQKVSTSTSRDYIKLDSGAAGKIPDSVKQQLADMETTKQKLAELERAKSKVDTGPVSSGLKEIGKAIGYESTVAVPFEANINDVVASYARGMEGGRMTDQDILRYKQIMPNFRDNDEQFKAKLQGAKERLRIQEEALRKQYGLPMSKDAQIEKQKQGLK